MACQGQLVPVAELADLFKLIGTTFGGDGDTNFALPSVAPLESRTGRRSGSASACSGTIRRAGERDLPVALQRGAVRVER